MTKEDKELLLKDLLGRVLYGVKVDYHGDIFTLGYSLYLNNSNVAFENYPMLYFLENIDSVKPYLRPMSSMTKDEEKELGNYLSTEVFLSIDGFHSVLRAQRHTSNFLYSRHLDILGLIEKGLALEAPEDMYNI